MIKMQNAHKWNWQRVKRVQDTEERNINLRAEQCEIIKSTNNQNILQYYPHTCNAPSSIQCANYISNPKNKHYTAINKTQSRIDNNVFEWWILIRAKQTKKKTTKQAKKNETKWKKTKKTHTRNESWWIARNVRKYSYSQVSSEGKLGIGRFFRF